MRDELEALVDGSHPLAAWQGAGVSRHEVRRVLARPGHHGRHVWAGADPTTSRQRALQDASVVPPDGALGGWGAAHLLGVDWIDGTTSGGDPLDGLVCMPFERRVRRDGLRAFRSRLDEGDVMLLPDAGGVRVTSPLRTAFDLARTTRTLGLAVTYLDVLARHGVMVDEVRAYADERRRWRGVRLVRAAAALARGRVRSSPETAWRLLWVLGAGIPTPLVNATLIGPGGAVVAEVDLLDMDTGLVGEYDGSPHAGADARARDHARQERLERLGLTVVRCTATDLAQQERMASRVRAARERASLTDRAAGDRRWQAVELPLPDLPLRPHVPATLTGHTWRDTPSVSPHS